MIRGLKFRRRNVADRLEKPAMVEPVDPFERGELDSFQRAPWPAPADQLIPTPRDADSLKGIPRRGRDLIQGWRTEEVRRAEADAGEAGL